MIARRDPARAWGTVAVVALSLVVCGCGSSDRAKPNGEQSKPPARILADAVVVLRSAGSFAMRGTLTGNGEVLHVSVLAHSPRSLEVAFANGPASTRIILTGRGAYIYGSAAFWRAQAGPGGVGLAGHWFAIPAARARTLAAGLGEFAPGTIARCLGEGTGTLTLAGRSTVDGVPAVVLRAAGDVPGSSPGLLAVAATGRPYPLQATALGPTRPGGTIDVCNDGKGSDVCGSLAFSRFGEVPVITAPWGGLSLGRLASGA